VPIIERDPWRDQYFEGVYCPEDIVIPTDDEHAYELHPEHRWIYNKLRICDSQSIPAAPHGVAPPEFPVFSKPIYNMHGMGVDGLVIESETEMARNMRAGHMWMTLLRGEHVSSDAVVLGGEAQWWRHSVGRAIGEGMFDYWTVLADERAELEEYCGDWMREHLRGYSGAVNLETIGGKLIEVHLRFADQWPDLYGRGWLDAIVDLYARRRWRYPDEDRREGYSVVLFGSHGRTYAKPPQALLDEIAGRPGVSSLQITFHDDLPAERHVMPPGGFRLAVVNCWSLPIGMKAREDLAKAFWPAWRRRPAAYETRNLPKAG
jgi:hypothetical protein